MKWLLASCAAVALSGAAASAGPCSEQITALQRSMSARDAGAGAVQTTRNTSEQVSEAGSSHRTTPEASRSAAEVRTTGQDGGAGRTGPTDTMSRATAGSAASPQDVRLQQQGQPTQAEAAQSGRPAAATGEDKLQKVAANLDRARSLDRNNDSGCLTAVSDARRDMAAD
jgi:hypothetical protein